MTGDPRWPACNGILGWAVSTIQYFDVLLPGLSTFCTLAVRKELGSEVGANRGSGTLSAHLAAMVEAPVRLVSMYFQGLISDLREFASGKG